VTTDDDRARAIVRYALVGLALTVAVGWTLYLVRGVLLLVYVAAVFAVGLSPIVSLIERRRPGGRVRVPRWAAVLSIYLSVLALFALAGSLVLPPLAAQARDLWAATPALLDRWQQWLIDRGVLAGEFSLGEAVRRTATGGTDVVEAVVAGVSGFVGGVFGLVTIPILTFYLLLEGEAVASAFVRLFPRATRPRVETVCRRAALKVSAWLAGQLLLGAIIALTAGLGLWLIGVPYFYVLALIAGIGEMVPVVGPFLAAIPAVGVAFSVSPATALFVALFFLAQQQVENHVLVPRVMQRQIGVSPVVVIVALLVGGSLLGIVGALLAVPTAAILQVVVQELTPGEG
jgi:predicted PurR-regulated permease PerM